MSGELEAIRYHGVREPRNNGQDSGLMPVGIHAFLIGGGPVDPRIT